MTHTTQLHIQFARLVLDPRHPYLYLRENEPDGWTNSMEEAVHSGRSYCGTARDEILALDDDQADDHVLDDVAERLRGYLIEPVIVASGGLKPNSSPRRHLFARVPDSRVRSTIASSAAAMGLNWRYGPRRIRRH